MSRKKNNLVAPVLKWVGGKRQLIPEIEKYFPDKYSTYYEPFIGGGAVLFNFQPKRAVVNDINEELINLYKVIKDDVESLIEDLKNHKNESEYFYEIRSLDRNKEIYDKLLIYNRGDKYEDMYKNNSMFDDINNGKQSNIV